MSQSRKDESETRKVAEDAPARKLGVRHIQIAVMSTAAFMAYVLRTNLSIAIVAMVGKHDVNATTPLAPVYEWDEHIQGYVLSSFFWGYLITQIPAGILTERFGGHRFLCAGIISSSLLSLVLPLCAYFGGWMLVCANRVLKGICQGFVFPSIYTLLGVWAPPAERGTLAGISVSAQLLGAVAASPLSGFLCAVYGWPSVFYILGGVGTGVGVAMIFLGADSPSKHRMISHDEKHYIQTSLGGAKEELPVPWRSVFTSVPYFAAMVGMAFQSLVYITFLTEIPTFLGTVLKYGMGGNCVLSALPYLTSWILAFVFSWISDILIDRGWLKLTSARKVFNSIGHFGSAICLVLLAHSGNRFLSVVLLTLTVGCQAGVFVGISAGLVDLAPNFSGTLFSISNFVAAGLGICGPIIVGYIVTETGSVEQWRTVFYLCAMVMVLSNVAYLIWGTSETQWWNWSDRYKDEDDYRKKREKEELSRRSVC